MAVGQSIIPEVFSFFDCYPLAKSNQLGYTIGEEVLEMSKTANVFTRVEPEVKSQAEMVLKQLGIPMSNAIEQFLRQIVLQRGIPFEMKLPEKQPLAYGSLTKEQFDAEIEKGMADIAAGRLMSSVDLRAKMRETYGV